MNVSMRCIMLFSLLLVIEASSNIGRPGDIKIISINVCDVPPRGVKLDFKHSLIDDQTSAFSANFTIITAINDFVRCTIDISKLDDSGWKNVYKFGGPCCSVCTSYIPKLMEALTKSAGIDSPPCPLEAGSYEVDNFQANSDIVDFPQVFYGRLLISLTAKYATGQGAICVEIEGDMFPPK